MRVGLDYRLGRNGIDPGLFTKGAEALELDRFAVHGQMTFIEQYDAPFRSPYLGAHSLDPNQGRESWDVMYFVGAKLWQGAEFWVDPEIDQGFGLSNTEGIAGFPSGASFKVGASVPYSRVQRAFIRQTIDLGGDSQKVAADQNQFAGTNTINRLVITIGKYSVSDVFDQNKYAQNPRKDFMNWALIDAGTFDYAADAWGYSYGASAEWYQGDWTVRGGVFDLTDVPNSEQSRFAFRPVSMARRNRAPLRIVEPSRQDRRHRLSHPRPARQPIRMPLPWRRRPAVPPTYRRGAPISQPHRPERQSRTGNHRRSRRLCAHRLCQRQYRAGFATPTSTAPSPPAWR